MTCTPGILLHNDCSIRVHPDNDYCNFLCELKFNTSHNATMINALTDLLWLELCQIADYK